MKNILILIVFITIGVFFVNTPSLTYQKENDMTDRPSLKTRDPLSLSYQEYLEIDDMLLIDVREDEERKMGYILDSLHVRAADILTGYHSDFSRDETIVVYCFTGSRSREVAHYLDDKGYQVRFLNLRLDDFSQNNSEWIGKAYFEIPSEINTELSLDTLIESLDQDVLLIDSRNEVFYNRSHIEESLSLPVLYTPTDQIDSLLLTVPEKSRIIMICDSIQRSCFSAFITAMKLKSMGHHILGYFSYSSDFRRLQRLINDD